MKSCNRISRLVTISWRWQLTGLLLSSFFLFFVLFSINFSCLYKLSCDNHIINKHQIFESRFWLSISSSSLSASAWKFFGVFFFVLVRHYFFMSWIKDNCMEEQSHITTQLFCIYIILSFSNSISKRQQDRERQRARKSTNGKTDFFVNTWQKRSRKSKHYTSFIFLSLLLRRLFFFFLIVWLLQAFFYFVPMSVCRVIQ